MLTYVIVTTGFDWSYFVFFKDTLTYSLLFPAVAFGGLVPILAPLMMLAIGRYRKNVRLTNAAWGIGQAAIMGSFVSSFYKAFTGRMQPPRVLTTNTLDISHGFRFGFWRGGIFWGWPSSHTTIAFAVAFTIWALYSNRIYLRYFVVMYAAYVGLGVSMSIHWFSDFVAGAIIGTIIGVVVVKSFKERYEKIEKRIDMENTEQALG